MGGSFFAAFLKVRGFMDVDKFITYCVKKANETQYVRGRFRHYCCIVDKKGVIVSEAANSYIKTSPVMFNAGRKVGVTDKCFCHAEMLALVRAKGRGYKLAVARINKNGKPVNSKPCPICLYLIEQAKQIKVVVYSI